MGAPSSSLPYCNKMKEDLICMHDAWPAVCVDGGVVFLMPLIMLGMDGSTMDGTMYFCSLSTERQQCLFVG